MAFQSTVRIRQGFGVVGEIFDDGPKRSQIFTLVSALASYNVFGRGFSITGSQTPIGGQANANVAAAGNSGGTAIFAGILCNPKSAVSLGDGINPLNPSLALPNQAEGELLREGCVYVQLPAAANVGDLIIYNNTTGVLASIAPGAPLTVGFSSAYATVDYFPVVLNGGVYLALIRVLATPQIPVLA